MKLRILDAASQDLIDGYRFYEKQEAGLGSYFLDSLFSDIDSLQLYAGIHAIFSDATIAHFQSVSRLRFIQAGRAGGIDPCGAGLPQQPGVDQGAHDKTGIAKRRVTLR